MVIKVAVDVVLGGQIDMVIVIPWDLKRRGQQIIYTSLDQVRMLWIMINYKIPSKSYL